jgi:hypothetical protein
MLWALTLVRADARKREWFARNGVGVRAVSHAPLNKSLEAPHAMPAVRMPLFEFHMLAAPTVSLGHGLSIDRFEFSDAYRIPLFSQQDVYRMRRARWALVFEGDESDGYRSISNAALVAFRIFALQRPPFIKYRLAAIPEQSTRISQPMTYNYAAAREQKPYSAQELEVIRLGFDHMQAMDAI